MEFWTHCIVILIDKYFKNKETEHFICYGKFTLWPFVISEHITELLAIEKMLIARPCLYYI